MILKKKTFLSIGLSLCAMVLLAACGNGDSESAAKTKDGKTVITMGNWTANDEAKELHEIIDKLNEKSDTYEIKPMDISKDYTTKIQTMIAGKNAPDLFWLSQELIPDYANNKAILDIQDQFNGQEKIKETDFIEGSLDTSTFNDDLYGLPWIRQPYVVYYNKSMFEEMNVDLPQNDWTWADFASTAKKLTHDDVYGFANAGQANSAIYMWGAGGDYLTENQEIVINTPKSIEGLNEFSSIVNDETVTMPYSEASAQGKDHGVEQIFVNGKAAMIVGGANDTVERKVREAGDKFDVGMAVMPAGKEQQVTFNWTASTVISSQTKNKEAAFEALVDLTNAFYDWKIPAPIKGKEDSIGQINPDKEYAIDVITKSVEISRGYHNFPKQNELLTKQNDIIDYPILTNNDGKGKLDIDKIAKDAQESFEKVLGK